MNDVLSFFSLCVDSGQEKSHPERAARGPNNSHMRYGTVFGVVWRDSEEVRIDRFHVLAVCSRQHGLQRGVPLPVPLEREELPGVSMDGATICKVRTDMNRVHQS